MENLSELLEPLAAWFRGFGMPEPIVHWGHPVMMGIVVFVMGSFAGFMGWRGRLAQDQEVAQQSRLNHSKVAPFMFLFITLGYTGGVLSLVMQGQPILESPHFWTGSSVIIVLGINALLAFTGFGGKTSLRMVHAYLGSVALCLLLVHAFLGLQLGLSI